jgi:hypothetical protein
VCGVLASVAIGCGADRSNLIPGQRASDLTGQLDDIKADIDAGACDGLSAKVDRFHDDATGLPNTVDARLRRRINDGVQSLQAHALNDCRAAADSKSRTETTDTTTETTPTETTPADTGTTTEPPADTVTIPPTATDPGPDPGDGTDNGGTPGEEQLP